jgi:branched-chain amino acid transport system ATP-binding protein
VVSAFVTVWAGSAAAVSDRAYVIEKGGIRYQGTMDALEADDGARAAYLTV